jgi:EAL domain-containing protein (putative c-di-GMP-specific phosphodiesterase class I)
MTASALIAADIVKPPSVLIVDDDEQVLNVHARGLRRSGFDVTTAASGQAALVMLKAQTFDVILSDIDMPGMTGIQLLARVRAHDMDVPVILITGVPSLETAVQALDRGALRYLSKPTSVVDLAAAVSEAVRLHRLAVAKRQALALTNGAARFSGDQAGLTVSFERALSSLAVWYQPIVSWPQRTVVAYEALMRSAEPSLPTPVAMLDAAERLGRVHELGRVIRALAIQPLTLQPDMRLFLNIHPLELLDDELLRASALSPYESRITIEVTERASLERIPDVRQNLSTLRAAGFRLALDDFGAGFGGLTSFALLQPDVVKLDMALVRDIDADPMKQSVVKTTVQMCRELGIEVVAEGIERPAERDMVLSLGCSLLQGFLFGRPQPEPSAAAFEI